MPVGGGEMARGERRRLATVRPVSASVRRAAGARVFDAALKFAPFFRFNHLFSGIIIRPSVMFSSHIKERDALRLQIKASRAVKALS